MAGLRTASILQWLLGLGFGIPGVFGIQNLAAGRGILYFMGFPTYGKGPFERVGIQTSVPLLSAFVLLCLLECIAGWLLWSGDRTGAVLALALLPLGAAFWWGFALPIPPVLAVVAAALIAFNWEFLR
jgi:hypothetical protein